MANLRVKGISLVLIWILLFLVGLIAVVENTNFDLISNNQTLLLRFLLRVAGVVAFELLFFQIILGSFMNKLIQIFGGWIFSLHILQGILTFTLLAIHPLFLVLFNYKVFGRFDPFYAYVDLCGICKTADDYYLTLGRVAFWLVLIAVTAAKFRTIPPLRKNWRMFHVLNYVAFLLVAIHAKLLGTDVNTAPFSYFWLGSVTVVGGIILWKITALVRHQISRGS